MAEESPKSRPQIVLFGSSLVQYSYDTLEGWGATLSHLYARKADIVFRGYAAWNSRRAVQHLDQIFPMNTDVQPSLVIVHFGNEDSTVSHSSGLGPHVPIEEYAENIRKIAQHLLSFKDTSIIFLSTTPVNEMRIPINSDGNTPRTNKSSELYKSTMQHALDKYKGNKIWFIDLFTAIQKTGTNDCLLDDGVNLSADGHTVVWNEILSALQTPLQSWNLYWSNMESEFGENSNYDPVSKDGTSTTNIAYYAYPDPRKWGGSTHQAQEITLHLS